MLASALGGCPGGGSSSGEGPADDASTPPATTPSESFHRQAHAKALAALREQIRPVLRLLDPVTAAQVEGTGLRPPSFGAGARSRLRAALEPAQREAEGIKAARLSPEDGMALRTLRLAIDRGQRQLRRPPWRDDPRAVLHALEPYLEAMDHRLATGGCEDGCGVEGLANALRDGFAELGSTSSPTLAAAREDLAALRTTLGRRRAGLPDAHPLAKAHPAIEAELVRLEALLHTAAQTMPDAAQTPWAQAVAPAPAERWTRRPARWGETRLRAWLDLHEAYGRPPDWLFEQAEATLSRLRAMEQRDRLRDPEDRPVPRPWDEATCEAAWAPLQAWARDRDPASPAALDCRAALALLPPDVDSGPGFILHLIEQGIVVPGRRARVEATAPDVAMVAGRAARVGQSIVMQIAVTADIEGHHGAERRALQDARALLCGAATAVWIHGGLGDDDHLRARLAAQGCEDAAGLVAAAEARPRTALSGLGLVLLGTGPADAAALERYWWAPMGLVRDLALPPGPAPQTEIRTKIEPLTPTAPDEGERGAGPPPVPDPT